jgi:hypothetical protein
MRGLSVCLALASFGFFLHHRHTSAVHLHVQNGNWRSHDDGQIQLHGSLDFLLFAARDIVADGLRRTFHRFGGNLQACQNLHLFAAVIKGNILADRRLHPAHPRRVLGVLNIHLHIGGELAGMTVRA